MKARNFKRDRHLAYAQRKRDKAQARRKDYERTRNMLANGQKRSNALIEPWRQPPPVARHTVGGVKYRPGGLLAEAA